MSWSYWFLIILFLVQSWTGSLPVNIQPIPCDLHPGYIVRFHPDDALRVGDIISIEVFSTNGQNLQHAKLHVAEGSKELGSADFSDFGQGQYRAVLQWVWDTTNASPGNYSLSFSVVPNDINWVQTVRLQESLAGSGQYKWQTAQNACCEVHYISNTAAERDLDKLLPLLDEKAIQAAAALNTTITSKMQITLVPRLLGHGGFTTDEIVVSYPDTPYTDADFLVIVEHEMVHLLDGKLGGEYRPIIFIEGLAVYLTGGHYYKEPLMPKAAALVDLGRYIPLSYLANNFYPSQHEIGYLEAGALIAYMDQTWGWENFSSFYRDMHPDPRHNDASAIDSALQKHFNITFPQLEDRFLQSLSNQPVIPDLRTSIGLEVDLYDSLRLYQVQLDPSAYYQRLWMPSSKDMRSRMIVADYLRSPEAPVNQLVIGLLRNASQNLRDGQFSKTEIDLIEVRSTLKQAGKSICLPATIVSFLDKYEVVPQEQSPEFEVIAGASHPQSPQIRELPHYSRSMGVMAVAITSFFSLFSFLWTARENGFGAWQAAVHIVHINVIKNARTNTNYHQDDSNDNNDPQCASLFLGRRRGVNRLRRYLT